MPSTSTKLASGALLGLVCLAFWGQERSLARLGAEAAAKWTDGMKVIEAAVQEAGWMAPLYFLVLYTVSSVFCLPLLGFHTVAGYTYGTLHGALLVSICQTVGAGFSMLFARHFARPMVQGYLEQKWGARYKAVDRAVAKQGLKVGCTQLDIGPFLLGTWAGVLPGTTVYCSIGEMGRSVEGGQSDSQRIVMMLQLCAGIAACKVMSDIATRTLKEAGVSDESEGKEAAVETAQPSNGYSTTKRRKSTTQRRSRSRSRSRNSMARSPSPKPSRRKNGHRDT